jgi:hypothetical protein
VNSNSCTECDDNGCKSSGCTGSRYLKSNQNVVIKTSSETDEGNALGWPIESGGDLMFYMTNVKVCIACSTTPC